MHIDSDDDDAPPLSISDEDSDDEDSRVGHSGAAETPTLGSSRRARDRDLAFEQSQQQIAALQTELISIKNLLQSSAPPTHLTGSQPWEKNSSSKAAGSAASLTAAASTTTEPMFEALRDKLVGKVVPKSMEAAGMRRKVASVISIDAEGALKQGTSTAFMSICSGGLNNATTGLQLTKSKFLILLEAGFYPCGLDRKYFEDLSSLCSGIDLTRRLVRVRTDVTADEPMPEDASLGLVDRFEVMLLNMFSVVDVIFRLSSIAAQALYQGLVRVPTD